ncbi:Rha family transcriptional regulator [Paenibacillus sp. UKAQ_18]|nr:Rha family transcriptional regulator [Paenibacillus sp. UKAQ_18]
MTQLKIINQYGQMDVDSREVAEMADVRHADIMRSIAGYIRILENAKLRSQDFFIPSTYKVAGNNKTYDCYRLTRKGCDMVANKMTGDKGILFTAAYVTKFEEMERAQSLDITVLSPQLQLLIQMEQGLKQIEERQQRTDSKLSAITETFLQQDENWRQQIKGMLNGAAQRLGGHREVRSESYKLLEERARCKLNTRLTNLKERLAESGATKTKINDANRLDVIESEPRLKEIYTTIVKELAIGTLA